MAAKAGPIQWKLEMRGFVSEDKTPTHDGREGWNGPWVTVGQLEIPQRRNLDQATVDKALGAVEDLGFSIGNRWDPSSDVMKGRGVLNEFREEVYKASQSGRGTQGAKAMACPMGFG